MTTGAKAERDATALSHEVLPWRALSAANGRIAFRGSAVQVAGIALQGVDFDATLRDGILSFDTFRGKLGKSELGGSATIESTGNGGRVGFVLNSSRLSLAPLAEQLEAVRAFSGDAAVRVQLTGAGDSVAGILGAMSGSAEVRMGPGKLAIDLPGTGNKALAVGPGAIFGMLVPSSANETDIRCSVLRFTVRDGVLRNTGTVAESAAAVVVVEGSVDFVKERMTLRFTPHSKGPALWLAIPVEVAGSLSAPRFGMAPGANSASAGGALSPFAVFVDRLLNSSDNACREAGRGYRERGRRPPSQPGQAE